MKLLLLNLRVTLYRFLHWMHTLFFYYPAFLWSDLQLARFYLFKSPYQWADDYGETPLQTLDRVATAFGILSHHRVMELGCGTGRTCLWLNRFIGCSVIGIDHTYRFIKRARAISSEVEFRCADILNTTLDADILYFYGTSFPDTFIRKLAQRITAEQKIITVSFPLSDYDNRFQIEKKIVGSFPWGKTEIYLNYIAGAQDPAPCGEFERELHSNS